jgi:hypothetical protein
MAFGRRVARRNAMRDRRRLFRDHLCYNEPGAAPTTQILFGNDHPYRPPADAAGSITQLGLSATDLQAIGCDSALTPLRCSEHEHEHVVATDGPGRGVTSRIWQESSI